ncbi:MULTISPECIES: GDP-mannose 4,6-dehydratase [Clostridia]|uniref:dTDP-glucose 4,6-dehydratase n=1 Tax=Clostridia TaxID=186801 RepID=UPI000EA27899|nr:MULTISPECIES: GDP-mannose 4,6-dehydratase [Clostridia]NBJ68074.1 NAD-dependent epimerase/dehydratase family protein [Roseburia sp. 1XD42-34]RKI82515.1 NAD-dependent epimerase/dehydratase family protein [Clostridium sp. 1xD42-85]
MNVLVTGGVGFIGRWVVDYLLRDGHNVWILDDLSNGKTVNIQRMLRDKGKMVHFIKGDIKDLRIVHHLFANSFDICFHLAASINVQDSIDRPRVTFENDVIGTFNILELCKKNQVKFVFMSTCMVYEQAWNEEGIRETNPVKPASPYAGSKLAAENMVLSYHYAYGLPATILRPFNTYGPYQKTGGEGGVVAIFLKNKLAGRPLKIYGDGTQTRDLLYVEDCARFVVEAGYSDKVNGEIIHAGSGKDISIHDLANLMVDESQIKHVPHIHPQSEVPKLLCDYSKAKEILNWKPNYTLEEGITKTEEWMKSTTLM